MCVAFLCGADKTCLRTNLATSAGVVYRNLYTGLDLQYTQGHSIAVGSNGVVYVTGYTGSSDLTTLSGTSGYQPSMGAVNVYGDAFVARLDAATGMVTGGTYLGGVARMKPGGWPWMAPTTYM